MLFHGLCITKSFTAVCALAWFLSCVNSFVVSPIVKRYESLVTIPTDVRFLPSVNKFVFRQVMSLTKCLSTLVAFVRSTIVMNVHVLAVLRSCGERFSAFCTLAIVFSLFLLHACENKQTHDTIIRFLTYSSIGLLHLKFIQFSFLKE